jgi:hypothetical protein
MKLISKIYKEKQSLSLILRHAERHKIKKSEFGNNVLLNDAGIRQSFEFGKKISEYHIAKIYTSPIQRCVQSAENIVKGYNKEIQIIETKMLGAPGIHVSNEKQLGEYYFKYGFWEIFKNFKSNIKVDGLKFQEQLQIEFYSYVSETTDAEGLTLYITHDWLIAFFAYAANIYEYTEKNWIDYLSGLIIDNKNNGYKL